MNHNQNQKNKSITKAALAKFNCGICENDVRHVKPNGFNQEEIRGIVGSYELNKKYGQTTNYRYL